MNSRRMKDLNVKTKTVKLLEENVGKTFFDINCSNISLYLSPKAREPIAKINKVDYIKLKLR